MVLCKSQKLYFRTSLGLFPISSIDYKSKQLTISHTFCSSSLHFVSPSLLSAGFPRPESNSLLLFNCSKNRDHLLPLISNCTHLHGCKAYSDLGNQELEGFSSCLLVDDLEKMKEGFDPKDLNCSHYSRVYRRSTLVDGDFEGFELGTRISFDIPDHVPNICDECQKPNGNCGVGLRCVCHPKECKDKVVSIAVTMNPFGNILFSLLPFTVAVILFKGY
ncbi:uncharacterized protein LOC132270087 [Cornus florida]|uniref:uncharacterized protein LOC132270087 n=1 Tax=Cornus florida TaxID=4283 RepID=UPI002896C6BC|nr:uncharacterized protein LOC132270087 [Cornus florida]